MRIRTTCHYFLTNIGSLMVRMKKMNVHNVKHFDVRFVGIVPRTCSHSKMVSKSDPWTSIRGGGRWTGA